MYQGLHEKYQKISQKLNQKYNALSWGRLLLVVISVVAFYFYFSEDTDVLLYVAIGALAGFFVLMNWHQRVGYQRKLIRIQQKINQEEIKYQNEGALFAENGKEWLPEHHFYAHDLDLFGEKSLFQHLNRTATSSGSRDLAERLLNLPEAKTIIPTQKAVQELSPKVEWRQHLQALGRWAHPKAEDDQLLLDWVQEDTQPLSKVLKIASFVMPVLLWITIGLYAFVGGFWLDIAGMLLVLNLLVAFSQFKRMQRILISSDRIDRLILRYSKILQSVENQKFTSEKLKDLQTQLFKNQKSTSQEFQQLSSLFSQMDSLQNILVAIVLNGLGMYHLHIFGRLAQWKRENKAMISNAFCVLGEIESLNSLANFAYNHSEFTYPTLTEQPTINFQKVGHPLLSKNKRVDNTIDFSTFDFVILTGSNMSGKSTFLRTLGVNLVLARLGSVVCAEKAEVYPFDLLVSMRLNDSLSDSESYFFAEVKRLGMIANQLDKGTYFVLLDEILRGTNSDDKRNGTIGYLDKLMQKNAKGVIATHDLEVCAIQSQYPKKIENYYFDAAIKNEELHFDYQLKKGICQSRSATFLMKKMGVIE